MNVVHDRQRAGSSRCRAPASAPRSTTPTCALHDPPREVRRAARDALPAEAARGLGTAAGSDRRRAAGHRARGGCEAGGRDLHVVATFNRRQGRRAARACWHCPVSTLVLARRLARRRVPRGDGCHAARERAHQGTRRGSRSPACRRSRTTPASRWTRWTAAPGVRGAARARRPGATYAVERRQAAA